jgi:hypothetical protein
MPAGWTTEELQRFTSRMPEMQKEAISKSLLCSDVVNGFMSTPEGKVIFDDTIQKMSSYLGDIIKLCNQGAKKNLTEIELLANKLQVSKEFIFGIASMTLTGDMTKQALGKLRAG